MHHKNNRNSTANFNNPQHHQPEKYPTGPVPQQRKQSALARFRERFREKPATAEEIRQLTLNTRREELKTRMKLAKNRRPSRFSGFGGGGERQPSYRRSSKYNRQEDSGFFGGGGGSFMDFGSGPSLSFLTGTSNKPRGKNQKSGLEELF